MSHLRVAHLSGQHKATHAQWHDALTVLSADHDVMTFTEAAGNHAALVSWVAAHPGWHVYHPIERGGSECAIVSRRPLSQTHWRRLTRLVLKTARKAPLAATVASTFGTRVRVAHLPAHNGGWSTRPAFRWPTRLAKACVAALRKHVAGPGLDAMDGNVDIRRPEIRKRFSAGGWTIANPLDQEPTHDHRAIEIIRCRGMAVISPTRTLDALPGFDHKPTSTTLRVVVR